MVMNFQCKYCSARPSNAFQWESEVGRMIIHDYKWADVKSTLWFLVLQNWVSSGKDTILAPLVKAQDICYDEIKETHIRIKCRLIA